MKRLLPFVLAAGMLTAAAAPTLAAPNQGGVQNALIGVLAQVALRDVNVLNNSTVEVITVDINDSLNNLLQNALQNADIDVLNDSLNNIRIIRDVNVDIQDITVVGDDLSIIVNALGDTVLLT